MRKDLLHAIANLASTQGYKKAKEAIENGIRKQMWIDIGPCVLPTLQQMKNWVSRLQGTLLITLINGIAEQNPKRWQIRFWDITPTLTRITETIHMMMGLFIVTVEAVIEKVVRQLKRNVPVLPT